ncbi:MAG: hypothetical protein HYY21_02855 [Candidatus Tectomicrobia bacterium]|nr:hypothetical protein [Candidatus Tectomicrobia bacterium]
MKRALACVALSLAAGLVPGPARGQDLLQALQKASDAISRNALEEAVPRLEEALRHISLRLPLRAQNAVYVKEGPKGYKMYQPREGSAFRPGEPILVYVEPVHYGLREVGEFREIDIRSDLRVMNAGGQVLFSKEGFGRFQLRTRGWNRELFITITVNLTGAPAGNYVLGIRLVDNVTGKNVDFTLPFTLSGG